eukprot:TRINITY_DN2998_c0_g3_i1.p1 TRINITY_DN2998_c0_g3~~TRINITY_DN2998_c0_g3_i1.p1  ORF type:complete len:312 (-),score=95.33 TRINITY_DN2998_c0_g3_i1:124-1059(-)
MDEKDLLQRLRISYHLTNYHKVLETYQSAGVSGRELQQHGFEIISLVARALVKTGLISTKLLGEFPLEGNRVLQDAFNIYNAYLRPLANTPVREEDIISGLDECIQAAQNAKFPAAGHLQLSLLHLWLANGDFSSLLGSGAEYVPAAERAFLRLEAFLALDRLDLAQKSVDELAKLDDDDVITSLAKILLRLKKGDFSGALTLIDETKEKFEDSIKLQNMKVVCFLGLRAFDKAFSLGSQIYSFLSKEETRFDKREAEIAISNTIVAATHLKYQTDALIDALRKLNPASQILNHEAEVEAFLTKATAAAGK